MGIPVLPLSDRGAFHGATWRIQGRNVIVLKHVGALANNVAYEVAKRGMNWWGAANNLQQSNSDSYNVAKGILFNNANLLSPALTLSDKEVFLSALDE
jgi:hypothetical protein